MIPIPAIPAALRARRKADRLSLRAVEKATGISPSTLCRIENEEGVQGPDTETYVRLSHWLETPSHGIPDTRIAVRMAIELDGSLTPDARRLLAEVFDAGYALAVAGLLPTSQATENTESTEPKRRAA